MTAKLDMNRIVQDEFSTVQTAKERAAAEKRAQKAENKKKLSIAFKAAKDSGLLDAFEDLKNRSRSKILKRPRFKYQVLEGTDYVYIATNVCVQSAPRHRIPHNAFIKIRGDKSMTGGVDGDQKSLSGNSGVTALQNAHDAETLVKLVTKTAIQNKLIR